MSIVASKTLEYDVSGNIKVRRFAVNSTRSVFSYLDELNQVTNQIQLISNHLSESWYESVRSFIKKAAEIEKEMKFQEKVDQIGIAQVEQARLTGLQIRQHLAHVDCPLITPSKRSILNLI